MPISRLRPVLFLILFGATACRHRSKSMSFYFWRTVFNPDSLERGTLRANGVRTLYTRYFDVDWPETGTAPVPLAPLRFGAPPGDYTIIPVVYIRDRVFEKLPPEKIPAFAAKEADLFEYQAVRRCMSDRITEAISAMREVPSADTAVKYYTLALGAARNDEQKAKCQYLLARCQRNEWYNKTYYNDPKNEYGADDHRPDFIAWEGFKALKQYAGTQYYKDVIRECGYFRTYIRAGDQPKTIHP